MAYHHGDLRGALLDAAEALVRERGVDGWSLREASARVGVSPSAAYHHFASRDALVAALAGRVLTALGERLRHAANAASNDATAADTTSGDATSNDAVSGDAGPGGVGLGDRQRRLVAFGRHYVWWAVEDPAVARLVFGAGPETFVSPHPHDVLVDEIARLELPPGAEFVVWATIHGLAVLIIDGLVHFDDHEAVGREAERLVRAVLTGLAAETPPPTPWPTPRTAQTERHRNKPR